MEGFESRNTSMEEIGGEGGKNFERSGEAGSRTGVSIAKFRSRRRVAGKPKGFAKRALSGKSIVTLTRPLLLNTKETSLGAITGVTLMRRTSTGKGVSGSIVCITILSTDDNRRRLRTTACQVSQAMATGTLEQDGAVLKDRRASDLTKKGRGIAKDKI